MYSREPTRYVHNWPEQVGSYSVDQMTVLFFHIFIGPFKNKFYVTAQSRRWLAKPNPN